jgi:NAD(P)-dependent dehydrogenase (short-subunit alcohol dehydrogenase family)
VDVHLMGAAHCCKAVWATMLAQKYGRIVMTTSSTGLYGNFGQANYGAAKLAQIGLMQTLGIEGAKHGIRVNALAPTATTRMTEALFPEDVREAFRAEAVVPAMLVLAHESARSRRAFIWGWARQCLSSWRRGWLKPQIARAAACREVVRNKVVTRCGWLVDNKLF